MMIKYERDRITVSGAWKVLGSFGFAEQQIRQLLNAVPKSDKYFTLFAVVPPTHCVYRV